MMNAEIGQGFEPGVGALLRASRLRCGEELRDVADILRIRYPYLEAIEDGNYQKLPGVAYAIGFVRAYADHLGLDTEEVVRRFKTETENLERRTELVFPSPIPERGTPGAAIIFVGLLVAAVAYGAWYIGTSEESVFDDLVSPLPARLAALVGADETEEATEPAPLPETSPEPVTMTTPTETEQAPVAEMPPADATEVVPDGADGMESSESAEATPPAPEIPPVAATVEPSVAPATEQAAEGVEDAADAVARATTDAIAAVDAATPTENPAAEEAAAEVLPEPPSAPEFTTPIVASPPAAPVPAATEPDAAADQLPATDTGSLAEPVAETAPQVAEVMAPEAPAAEPGSGRETDATGNENAEIPATDVSDGIADAAPAESPVTAPSQPDVADATEVADAAAVEEPPTEGSQVAALPQTDETDATAPEPAEPAQAAIAEPAPQAEPEVAVPAVSSGSRVVVRAKSDSWIQVRDGVARRLLVTRLLRAGDSYRVPDQPGLTLLTGNAGALEILVDGEPVNSIGEVGAVRRNVALDAERLKDGTAVLD
jgi:cytoskeleton protein RodZ